MATQSTTLFADFTCPYCYLTEAALREVAEARGVEVRHHAYELFPAGAPAPAPADEPEWRERVGPLAEEAGLPLVAPAFRPRTRKAHEAARFAAARGVEAPYRAAVYRAYWVEGRDVGRIDVLSELVEPLGIDPAELKIALDIDLHREEVERDLALAERLRIRAIPALYLGTGPGAHILLGAQTRASLAAALEGGGGQ